MLGALNRSKNYIMSYKIQGSDGPEFYFIQEFYKLHIHQLYLYFQKNFPVKNHK